MKSPRPCPICGSPSNEKLYSRRFETISEALLDGYDVVVCVSCGFCFASNLPSPEEFDAYYEKQSKYEHEDRSGTPTEYDTRRLPFAVSIISEWFADRNARILDIGCANGGLLAELKKNGYQNLLGIDPAPSCARNAQKVYGIEVHTAPISRIPDNIGSFDLILLGSVLEHVLDLNGTVTRIARLLNPGGHVYVEIPDMTRCSLMNDAPFQEFSLEHINFFSPVSLQNLWGKHGFETIGVRQTRIELIPRLDMLEVKAMFRYLGGAASSPPERDDQTRPELERYISKSKVKLERIESVINSLAESKRAVVVWGVGTHTQSLMATTRLQDVSITAFVDSNPRYVGQRLNGIPIRPVSELKNYGEPILISSQQFQTEIVASIRALGVPNKVITLYD